MHMLMQKFDLRALRDLYGGIVADGGGVEVQLNNVLVVQDLPVPLHISAKSKPHMLGTGAFGDAPFFVGGNNMEELKKESFPERYRGHPYWQNNGVIYLGGPGAAVDGIDAA